MEFLVIVGGEARRPVRQYDIIKTALGRNGRLGVLDEWVRMGREGGGFGGEGTKGGGGRREGGARELGGADRGGWGGGPGRGAEGGLSAKCSRAAGSSGSSGRGATSPGVGCFRDLDLHQLGSGSSASCSSSRSCTVLPLQLVLGPCTTDGSGEDPGTAVPEDVGLFSTMVSVCSRDPAGGLPTAEVGRGVVAAGQSGPPNVRRTGGPRVRGMGGGGRGRGGAAQLMGPLDDLPALARRAKRTVCLPVSQSPKDLVHAWRRAGRRLDALGRAFALSQGHGLDKAMGAFGPLSLPYRPC